MPIFEIFNSKYKFLNKYYNPLKSGIPTSQFYSEGNGGEFRKSYHGYPSGYAQLIESPEFFHIQPMQIDTKNRHYNGTDFKPDLLPKVYN